MIGIYLIQNNINNKIYVGQSIHIETRVKEHFWKAKCVKDVSFNSALHSAIRKYGEENFSWRVLEECDISELDEKECYYIKQYNSLSPNGYNISQGGQKFKAEHNRCIDCGIVIRSGAKRCLQCNYLNLRKCLRPTREQLKDLIRKFSFVEIGQKFNVSDSAIRKWCKNYNLPFKRKEIKLYSEADWNDI